MTIDELRVCAKLPPPKEKQHSGPPPGWVPPSPPPEMESICEKAIKSVEFVDHAKKDLDHVLLTASEDNESALYVRNGAKVSAAHSVMKKEGGALVREIKDSSGAIQDTLPMLRGINSTVLVNGTGTELHLSDCQILSPCDPGDMELEAANGVFAVFQGRAFLKHVKIHVNGGFGHGLYDSQFGAIYASDCSIFTTGHCASALATDQPGGDLYITNTYAVCTGPASAGVYVDGGSHAELYNCQLESSRGEGAVLCNDGFLSIFGSILRGTVGAKIWQPVSQPGNMKLSDCTIVSTVDSAFVFDGGYGIVTMNNCTLLPALGQCAIESRRCPQHYDHIGNGTAILKDCTVYGDAGAADDCSLSLLLEHSIIQGKLHHVNVTVGYGSRIVFTGDSQIETLTVDTLDSLTSICPCTITYVPMDGGIQGTYDLPGGGRLVPREIAP